jgi:hypothetical protein
MKKMIAKGFTCGELLIAAGGTALVTAVMHLFA